MRLTDPDTILNMYQILNDFHDFCQVVGLEYWIAYGTLLGAVRHEGIIPWDDDVDVCIREKDAHILESESNINLLREAGYAVKKWWFGYRFYVEGGPIIRATDGYHCPGCKIPIEDHSKNVCNCESRYPFIDVFVMVEKDDALVHNDERAVVNFKGEFRADDVFPLKFFKFGEIEVQGPQNPLPFLNRVYGEDWEEVGREGYQHDTKEKGDGVIMREEIESWRPAMPTGPLIRHF